MLITTTQYNQDREIIVNKVNNLLKASIGLAMLTGAPTVVFAHGWSEFPSARQNICEEQGGVWSGTPPNAACAQAKEISGTYPFVQKNEYSINIKNYDEPEAVKEAIPDGTLCYANDQQKAGMGAPHSGWERTEVKAGTFEYVFNATAPHNPSYWEFYLTKPGADLDKALAWSDLKQIGYEKDVPIGPDKKYRMDVTIPPERSGDAILFVRWQRIDAAGEGFYNCSDITIVNQDVPPIEPPPEPSPEPDLVRGDLFVPADFVSPEIGDVVNYDIIDKNGSVARSFQVEVNQSNVGDWDRLLASEINGWHAEYKDGAVFIGDWHEEMNHYMYFKDDPTRNFFNSRDGRASGQLSISEEEDNTPPLTGDVYELVSSDNVVNAGEHVVLKTSEEANLTQTQGTPVNVVRDNATLFVVDTSAVTQTETLSFVAQSIDSDSKATFTFEVTASDEPIPPTPGEDEWSATAVYLGGEIVTYADSKWQAQWWIQGGDNPQMAYEQDQWGVWRPVK